jgi:type I restriction enzyme R subunit
VITEGMQILVQEVSLFSKEFEDKLAAVHQPDAQASEMEHAMRYEIHVKLEDNPVFYQSLRERLEAIVELRKQQRIDAAEQLKLFQALVDEMRSLGSTAAQLGLSETGYALYGLLQADDGTMTVQEAAATYNTETKELAELVERAALPRTEAVDWWQKDDLLRQMRRDIKRVLRGNVSEARLEALTAEMVDLIRRRRGQG